MLLSNFVIFIFLLNTSKTNGSTGGGRQKREVQECADKFKTVVDHSACQTASPMLTSAGVSDADKKVILNEHNNYRSNVSPPATNMLKLIWDDEVAMVAQKWAETCSFKHDESQKRGIPGRLSAGQNIGKGYTSWQDCIKDWHGEVKDFTYNGSNVFTSVGHYTQLVWAETAAIGCGFADCGTYNFHVCNYSPAGNVAIINVPYKTGTNCSACKTCDSTFPGLCDCGGKVCENGATLDTGTCTCSCKHPFHVEDICKLACRNLTEPYMCGQQGYDASGCITYSSTVPFDCPNTCGVCPAGGYTYTGSGGKDNGGTNITPFYSLISTFSLIIYLFSI